MSDKHIWLFDTTLRDGGQTRGVDFSVSDKIAISQALDEFGIDYVEAGWPGANPTDDQFFEKPPILKKSSLVAFGMTRRGGRSTENDPGFNAIINAQTDATCLVGKTWDFHVNTALNISMDENLRMITPLKMRDYECVMEIKTSFDVRDNYITKIIDMPTSRFSKYCRGIMMFKNLF